MDVTELLDGLNPPQREAVASPLNHQLVLAGAGSGKTRVLVHRIAWLMQIERISPSSIMAVTFTNKAAKEMRSRVEELTGISPKHLWIGTFHSLAHRLLRTHWKQANLSENFQVMDSDDQLRLIKRIVRGLNIDEEVYQPKQAQWYINAQKDEGLRPQHIQPFGDQWAQTMVTIYSAYEEACQRAGLVDFAELLFRAHELWLNNPSLLTQYQQRFRYILVDEFQDTNTIQYAWLRVLAGNAIPVMAVGDDDQSIYGWRGARIENIQQFSKDFAGAQEIKLEQNYRSTGNILKAANSVIDNNPTRLGKNLWTEGDQGEPIALYAAFNEQDEARFIVDQVESHFKNNDRKYEDMAVLYRSNAQSRVLEEAFIRAGLPYRIYGGQRFYERLEIKNAMAYLRLLQNRHDDASLERVINVPARAIGEKTVETLRQYAREHGTSLWQALEQAIRKNLLAARATTALQKFESLIDEMEVTCQNIDLHEQVDHVIQTSGLIEHHMKEKGEKAQARIENLEELVNAAKTFDPDDIEAVDENGEPVDVEYASPLAAFLDQAALDAGDAQADEFEDSVQMMTLHSAKGLEFPVVFMAGLEEGLFPHKMSADDPNRLEEERRLCYVGITRAMEKLYICYAESRRMYGQENFASPSRFIREIPHDTIEEVRLKATISKPVSQQFSVESAQEATGLKIGQQVWHAKFGEGTVLDMEGQGAQARVQVSFDFDGTKWLVAAYANLRPMES